MRKIRNKRTLEEKARQVRSDIIHMTSLAKSGHIGGPLGFVEPFLLAVDRLDLDPDNQTDLFRTPRKVRLFTSFA